MSTIVTNFLVNGTDLGKLFIPSVTNSTPLQVTATTINNSPGTFTLINGGTVTLTYSGNYLLSFTCTNQNSGNNNTNSYCIVLSPGSLVPSNGNGLGTATNISFCTTPFLQGLNYGSGNYKAYNNLPFNQSGLFNNSAANTTYQLYIYTATSDSSWSVSVSLQTIFLGAT